MDRIHVSDSGCGKRFVGFVLMIALIFAYGCAATDDVVQVKTVADDKTDRKSDDIGEKERERIAAIKAESRKSEDTGIKEVINQTRNYTVAEYVSAFPKVNDPSSQTFTVGPHDIVDIAVYEEPDLARQNVQIGADGYISFPLIGRVQVGGLSPSEIERRISESLATGKYLFNAHVSVSIKEFRSRKFMILGSVKNPGTHALQASDKVLDAISRSGGIDSSQSGKEVMVIRTLASDTAQEEKIVIRIDLNALLKGDPIANLMLADKDMVYLPKAESFHIMGQVRNPGSYPYIEKDITIVEAISKAGGFTPIAAQNRTRIVRVENGVEKVIEVRVDEITGSGKKGQDVRILPGDIIIIPESYF